MELKHVEKRQTLAIRETMRFEELPHEMGRAFEEIVHYLQDAGIHAAGPPYALYHNMDMDNLDVEMGFPVSVTAPGSSRVKPCLLPGGRVLVEIHRGPYDTLEKTYNKLFAHTKEQGYELESFMYEFYLNDPDEVGPSDLETEVYLPIKG